MKQIITNTRERNKKMANEKIPDDFTGIITSPDGTKRWYKNGKLHREDGPAIEWARGSKHWYIEGLKHRTDGPAVKWPNGGLEWWVDGKNYEQKLI